MVVQKSTQTTVASENDVATRCTLYFFNDFIYMYMIMKTTGIYLVAISFSDATLVCVLFVPPSLLTPFIFMK